MGKQADTSYSGKPSKPQEIPAFLILFCGRGLRGVCLKDEQGCVAPAQRRGLDKPGLNGSLFPAGARSAVTAPLQNTAFIYKGKVLISHFTLKEKLLVLAAVQRGSRV